MGQPVVHFEIVDKDGPKLQRYYAELFGGGERRLEPDGLRDGRARRQPERGRDRHRRWCRARPGGLRGHVTFCVEVPDVEEALQTAERLGGTRVMGPERPMEMVEIGLFTDPEGHVVGLVKSEPSA